MRLLDRRGQTLSPGAAMTTALDPSEGLLRVELHIAALAEGDYVIDASLGAEHNNEQQLIAFRVGR
jgi:hypothetical protein